MGNLCRCNNFLVSCHLPSKCGQKRGLPSVPKNILDTAIEAEPWMAQHLGKRKASWQAAYASSSLEEDLGEATIEEDLGEVALEWDDLSENIHEAAAEIRPYAGSDFIGARRSSDWTVLNKAVMQSDRVVVMVGAGLPARFCGIYKLRKNPSFSYSWYAYEGAMVLATEHCRRMQYWYNIWQRQPAQQYTFAKEELDAYEETEAWKAFVAASPVVGHMRDRVQAIRDMIPCLPGS